MANHSLVVPDPCIRLPSTVRSCLLQWKSFLEVGHAINLSCHQHHAIEQQRISMFCDQLLTFRPFPDDRCSPHHLRARQEDIDEIIHQYRNVGYIDWLKGDAIAHDDLVLFRCMLTASKKIISGSISQKT